MSGSSSSCPRSRLWSSVECRYCYGCLSHPPVLLRYNSFIVPKTAEDSGIIVCLSVLQCLPIKPSLVQYSRDGTGSPGHVSPGQRFCPGRVTGQSVIPDV